MLASVLASVASLEVAQTVERLRRAVVNYTIAALFGLLGFGFLLGSLFIWTARRIGNLEASLLFGVGFLALSLIVIGVHKLTTRVRTRRAEERRRADMRAVAGAAAVALLPLLLKRRGGLALGLGLPLLAALGYAVFRENAAPDDEDFAGR